MIAKAIVDILSSSPAAPRSAAQGTGQPLQGFCESLLAASKSFSENNVTGDGGGKAGRRHESDSGDANTPSANFADAAPDGTAVLSPAASQQTRETNASVLLQGTSQVGLTAAYGGSTNAAGLFVQSLTTVGSAGTGSSIALTDAGSTSIVPPAGIQSSFTVASMLIGKMATARNTSKVADVPTLHNLRSTGLTKKQASIEQSSNSPANIFQSVDVQSNVIPLQVLISEPAASQEAESDAASQPTETVLSMGLAKAELNVASRGNAPGNISQPTAAQSRFIPTQMPIDESATMQNTSDSLTGETTENVLMTGLAETQSSVAQTSDVAANTSQPDVVQSNITPAQTASKTITSQSTWGGTSAEIPQTQTSDAAASDAPPKLSQPAVAQSNSIQAQIPLAGSATALNNSNAVPSQPMRNVTAVEIPEPLKGVAQAISTPENISRSAVVQSNLMPVQMPVGGQATTQNISNAVASRPTWNGTVTERSEAQASNAPATISQPAVIQSNFMPVQMPLAGQATTQNTTTADASQFALPARSIAPVETQAKISDAKTSPTSTSQIASPPKNGNADLSATLPVTSDAAPATNNSGAQDSHSPAAVNASSNADQNAVANDPAVQSPAFAVRAALIASVQDAVAPALKSDSTVQSNPQPATHDQSPATATASDPGGIAQQLASLPLFDRSIGTIQTIVSNLKPVSTSKSQADALTVDTGFSFAQAGTRKSADSASAADQKTNSQDVTTSGNQSQGNPTQVQSTTPAPISVHPVAVAAAAQNMATVSPNHTSSTPAGGAGVVANTSDNAARVSTALPQAPPVINTAKLIQSIGQSVMHVGMRSNEFGNISISTSAGKDMVSTQISLEHGELAKTLAAHLPEMQARLGGSQPMDVRIDMNGAATGQGTGTFGGASQGSSDQSRSGRQPAGNMVASHSGNRVAEQQFSSVGAAMPTGYARLDIRV